MRCTEAAKAVKINWKRILALTLAGSLLLGLAGCGAGPEPEKTEPPAGSRQEEPPETTVQAPQETEPETLASPEGFLYLTVSKITFTLAGENEDVYIGTIPREQITWGTGDETVAVFEDGILTAVGPGETTAFAQCGDERIECQVGCLAQTEEDLKQIDRKILRSAKRLPPPASETASAFFDDAAIVGDSITHGMIAWHTRSKGLGNILFLCQGGSSVMGFVKHINKPFYRGKQVHLEDALADAGRKKVFIMLGQNDVSFTTIEETMEQWDMLVDMIRDKNPDMEFYIQSCVPEWKEDHESNAKNEKLRDYNVALKAFCEEKGCHYIDLAAYVTDHLDKMPLEYNLDNSIHVNEACCYMWMQLLRGYAEYQERIGGSL